MAFKLSPLQNAVNQWVLTGTGSLLLRARAGTGKTSTLMVVIDTIIKNRLGDIAVMAFNSSIAGEIDSKLKTAGYDWKDVQAKTVHGFGFAVWRKIAPATVLVDKKVANIIKAFADETPDAPTVWNQQGATIDKLVSYGKQAAIGHLHPINDLAKWNQLFDHFDLDNDLTDDWRAEHIIAAAMKVYKVSLDQCRQVIDYNDMILAPLAFKCRFWPKKWVLVDEAQDTNAARRALALAMLMPKTGRMIFVGDEKQAIYGFTGADSDAMDQLRTATNASELPLNVTYRCPKAVVREANVLVPDLIAADTAPEGTVRSIAYEGFDKEGLSNKDAILCRNTAPLVELAFSLIAKGTPCRIEGRAVGEGLVKLAKRWKLSGLSALVTKLVDYKEKQSARYMSKNQEEKIQALVDQIDCLNLLIQRCQAKSLHSISDLIKEIQGMFGDTPEGTKANVLTLSTIHRSKGREWVRVYLLGRELMPSPYARKPHQIEQENNLAYVGITRAMSELVYVSLPPKKAK